MGKIHFLVGDTSTEAIDSSQTVLALLPETISPAVVATYGRQLYSGVKVLAELGSTRNILANKFFFRLQREDRIAAKRSELHLLETQLDGFAGNVAKRARLFINYLSSKSLIDRRLYPMAEKLRRQESLTTKDLTPLIEVLYSTWRKTAGAVSSWKQKIRDYVQTGESDPQCFDWLARFVEPKFGLYASYRALSEELRRMEEQTSSDDQTDWQKDLERAIADVKDGNNCACEVNGQNVQDLLREIIGCQANGRFFAEIKEVRQGPNKRGCLILNSSKRITKLDESAGQFIPLDNFSSMVSALDRALSRVVIAYVTEDPNTAALCRGHVIHSGLLLRAFLGETAAIRTLYPEHVMGVPNDQGLNEVLISTTRQAFEQGLLARLCAKRYGLEEEEFRAGLERAVSVQRMMLPLLPSEVHRLVDALEARISLQKSAEKLRASNQRQAQNLSAAIQAQTLRVQKITQSLKADFHMEPAKMFFLDDFLMDEIERLFGNKLHFLRSVLAPYLERRRAANNS
ncbi:MAG TPA: hypothetical protein VIE89_03910 [Candidatus Binatia bacterium]|jgi:hypothetical protein